MWKRACVVDRWGKHVFKIMRLPFNTSTCPPVLLPTAFSKIFESLANNSHVKMCWKKKITELHDSGRICLGQIVVLHSLHTVPLKTVCGYLRLLHLLSTNQEKKPNALWKFGISCATEWIMLIICICYKERKPNYFRETLYYVQISPWNFPELHRSYHRVFTCIFCSTFCLVKPLFMLDPTVSEESSVACGLFYSFLV